MANEKNIAYEEHTHYIRYDNGGAILEYDGKIYVNEIPESLKTK